VAWLFGLILHLIRALPLAGTSGSRGAAVPPASLVQWRQGRMKAEGSVGGAQQTEAVGGSATGRDTAENEAGHLVAEKRGSTDALPGTRRIWFF